MIYNEDCISGMKKLPEESIDMILTDPPYGMIFQSGYRKVKHSKIENDDNLDWLSEFAQECYRLAKNDTAHYIFCSWHKIDEFKQEFEKYFTVKNILVWVKNNFGMGDLEADFAPQTEFVLFLQKGRRKINGKRDSNVLNFRKTNNELHPTQKPVDLIEYLIIKFSDEGDTILDPFMCSGTTAIASINLNRKYIGFEIDVNHYNTTIERINNRNNLITLF